MSVRKADDFIADVERQFDWYLVKAGREVADRFCPKDCSKLPGRSKPLPQALHFGQPPSAHWGEQRSAET
jgi:hypothetical protein